MRYLLDVNVLVAWGWADHIDHDRAAAWIAESKGDRNTTLLTSAIPQLGFVRVSVQRLPGRLSVSDAAKVLAGMIDSLGGSHEFLADNVDCTKWPAWCRSASRTTDAHLLSLPGVHRAKLATLDAGIPGAFLLPFSRV
jgi:predicted nucleic acid-binding protein